MSKDCAKMERKRGGSVKRHRKAGGGVMDKDESPRETYEGAGSRTEKEAKDRKDTFKRGGAVKKHLGHVEGHRAHHRLDRPGRKRGGAVGANRNPLSTAAKTTAPSDSGEPG